MDPRHLRFLDSVRVGHLATADAQGVPHVLPVCFAATPVTVYIAIDEKPKNFPPGRLKRLRNIAENPAVALVADRYDDADWSRLGWVMVRGRADILWSGEEHPIATARLRERYPQYRQMALEDLPVIAIRIERLSSWGVLDESSPER